MSTGASDDAKPEATGIKHTLRKGRSRKYQDTMKKREGGFNANCVNDKLPEYNALFDGNLRHHFENRRRQKTLHSVGLIDKEGRVVDLEKNRSKLFIIEQEFKQAEKSEYWRMKEEQEMRRRVQKKRYEALEKARLEERLEKMKEDRKIRREILAIAHNPVKYPKPNMKSSGRNQGSGAGRNLRSAGSDIVGSGESSTFMTQEDAY